MRWRMPLRPISSSAERRAHIARGYTQTGALTQLRSDRFACKRGKPRPSGRLDACQASDVAWRVSSLSSPVAREKNKHSDGMVRFHTGKSKHPASSQLEILFLTPRSTPRIVSGCALARYALAGLHLQRRFWSHLITRLWPIGFFSQHHEYTTKDVRRRANEGKYTRLNHC